MRGSVPGGLGSFGLEARFNELVVVISTVTSTLLQPIASPEQLSPGSRLEAPFDGEGPMKQTHSRVSVIELRTAMQSPRHRTRIVLPFSRRAISTVLAFGLVFFLVLKFISSLSTTTLMPFARTVDDLVMTDLPRRLDMMASELGAHASSSMTERMSNMTLLERVPMLIPRVVHQNFPSTFPQVGVHVVSGFHRLFPFVLFHRGELGV